MSQFYETDPDDPEAPVPLQEYNGLKPGDHVVYENPAWRQPDGSYRTGGMDPPLVITELVHLGDEFVTAVLNEGEWEVNADNLALDPTCRCGRLRSEHIELDLKCPAQLEHAGWGLLPRFATFTLEKSEGK